MPWPPQGLYFKKDVNSVEDMKGVKFRSYNNATSRLAELTGMLPVTIEAAELSQAFATGVAESMISSGATGYDQKVWESLTNFSKDYTEFTYDGLREGGMKVEPASEELMTGLRAVGDTMTSEWLESSGDDGQTIVDGYKSMQ